MKSFWFISSCFLAFASRAHSQNGTDFPAPENVTAQATSNAVAIFWSPVAGATEYFITLSDGQEQLAEETRVAFGGLVANTEYTAVVAAVSENGTVSMNTTDVTITTLLPRVRNLRAIGATESSIEVTWDAARDTTEFSVTVQNNEGADIPINVTIEEKTAVISGLEERTFYFVFVRPLRGAGTSDTAQLRARTDGSGFVVNALWEGFQSVIGGDATVFRPLTIPRGTYTIVLQFPCSLSLARVWNADLNERSTNFSTGRIVIRQSEQWQRMKGEIGMNFYFNIDGDDDTCDLDNVTVRFGVAEDSSPAVASSSTNIPINVLEWRNTTTGPIIRTAGIVYLRLMNLYNRTRSMDPSLNTKPSQYHFVIAVNSGEGCPGGINIRYAWSMTRKSSESIAEASPNIAYFVQEGNSYFSNEPGFVYGYNPRGCSNRDGITAEVLEGGTIVNSVLAAPSLANQY